MKNVTVTPEEEVARWARVWAAEHNTSVSRFLGSLLRERMLLDRRYNEAMRRYVARKPAPLRRSKDQPYPSREEVHER